MVLFCNTPVSIADSGHRSLTSNTNGVFLIFERMYAVIPTNKGGEVTRMTSNDPFILNNPAKMLENTKEK